MTALLPELAKLPSGLVLDGELVAPDDDGRPSFPRLSPRILHGRPGIHVTFIVFDVLRVEGLSTMENSYIERRRLLEELDLQGAHWCTTPVFDDGAALFASVEQQGLEGIVAKPLESPYRPGERGWIKVKNRAYWRFGARARAEPAAHSDHLRLTDASLVFYVRLTTSQLRGNSLGAHDFSEEGQQTLFGVEDFCSSNG
jgi:ATP-dependent DNA ligase